MSIIFDENGLALNAGTVTVFNYNIVSREYSGSSDEYLNVGISIPASSCLDTPPEPRANFAICRSLNSMNWEYLPDHRGEIVYSTETGEPVEITLPGEYPKDTTPLQPATPYDKWAGETWVTDTDAVHTAAVANAEAEKTKLLAMATQAINLWQMQLQLGIITDANKEKLIEWIECIEAVQAVDTSAAPNITWPPKPHE